ncbi:MAG: efflux RND transporter permease subunit [Pirellulales bacterium]
MKFAQWVQSHHRSILFLLFTFALAGVWRGLSLPVSLFPRVSFPRIAVSLDAGDRPADRMAIEVTWPVEEAVRAVPGVRSVRSTTSRGIADVSINFEWGRDMVSAMLEIQSAINQKLTSLPPGTSFEVRRMDPTVFPVLGYSLTSDTHSLVELRDLAIYQIRPVLSTVSGVADIGVLGGATAEYQVIVNPAKLDSFGLSLDEVAKALSAANIITAVGRIEDRDKLYLIVSDTQFRDFDQIGQTVLRSGVNGLVLLEDVATVSRGTQPRWTRVTADGHDAVLFQVYQQPGGNTVEISREITAQLANLKGRLPSEIHIANWYDQSQLVVSSAGSVRDAVLIGVLLAAAVLWVFLGNLRVTLIAAVTVPVVLAATVLLLSILGMSFNIMTLGGMAAAVGLIVDDAIVMVEHVMRRLRTGQGDYRSRVSAAASEFTRPLAGSSASTVIIFAPLAFLSGVTGAFFKALSLTMAASLAISFLVAWLAVPLLAVRVLRQKDADCEEGGSLTSLAHRSYGWTMRRLLQLPWLILLILLPLLAAGWYAYQHTGSGFMPAMDEGGFILDYHAAAGTSLTETDRLLRQVEAILRNTPAVQTYSRRTGLQLGGGVTEANQGDFFVRLKPFPRPDIESVMDNVRRRIEHDVPGIQIQMAQLMEDLIGDLTAVPQPIEIKIYSDNEQLLRALAPRVAAAIEMVPGVVDVNNGIVLSGDALNIRVDREKAALEGVAPDSVTQMLQSYLTGVVTTEVEHGPQMIGLRVWTPYGSRDTVRGLEALRLRAPDGHLFPLTRVATVKTITGQPEITRDNLKRMVAVTGRISGRDMGSTIRSVKAILNRPGLLPKDVYYVLGGLYQQQQIAFRGLALVFVSSVVLVFVLLLFLYESFRVAIAMLLTTLLAVAAVFIGLWVTGTELNITAMMGMTMVIGIVTEVAIFYYSEYHDLPADANKGHERFVLAGVYRMRPIAMTTLAAILALLPLALGIGQGAAMQQPLAIAIISGLAVQLPLVLIALPSLLAIFGHGRTTSPGSV